MVCWLLVPAKTFQERQPIGGVVLMPARNWLEQHKTQVIKSHNHLRTVVCARVVMNTVR